MGPDAGAWSKVLLVAVAGMVAVTVTGRSV